MGCCVSFYIVNGTNEPSWMTNSAMRNALSVVHLNSTIVSSQSTRGLFSFVPPRDVGYYDIFFVNDEYPGTNTASAHVSITLGYTPIGSLYLLTTGFGLLGVGLGLSTLVLRRRKKRTEIEHPS